MSAPSAATDPGSAAASTTAPASAAAPAESPRAKDATKWLKDLQEDPEIDPAQRGRVATNGLSEEQFGLPAPMRKAMEVMTSNSVDPSQIATLVAATLLEPPMSGVLATQCGKPVKDVMDAARKAKPAEQAKLVVKECKLDALVGSADLAKLQYLSVLLSAGLQKLLEADPKHSSAELGLAKLIANLNRLDAK